MGLKTPTVYFLSVIILHDDRFLDLPRYRCISHPFEIHRTGRCSRRREGLKPQLRDLSLEIALAEKRSADLKEIIKL